MTEETTPAHVAQTATVTADVPRRGVVLLGTFGAETAPQALVRLPGGATASVGIGDALDGDRILAIEQGRLALESRGTARWLEVPG